MARLPRIAPLPSSMLSPSPSSAGAQLKALLHSLAGMDLSTVLACIDPVLTSCGRRPIDDPNLYSFQGA